MRLIDEIKQAGERAGLHVIYGDLEHMVEKLNRKARVNQKTQPALFFPIEFPMTHDRGVVTSKINVLITVSSSKSYEPEERMQKSYSDKLPELRQKFLNELKKTSGSISVKTKTEWPRPKVHQAFGNAVKNTTIFNEALDGYELIIEYKTDMKEC